MASASNSCTACNKVVRPGQETIQCDRPDCLRWTHRTCNTGISRDDYRRAVQEREEITFVCNPCTPAAEPSLQLQLPAHESTQTSLANSILEEGNERSDNAEIGQFNIDHNVSANSTFDISRDQREIHAQQHEAEKQNHVKQCERLFEEATELLEQMELEVKEQDPRNRQKYGTRVTSYKTELSKLQSDLRKAKLGIDSLGRDELLGEDMHESEDQRTRLLDNTERLERSGRKLEHGYRMAVETEQIGSQIMDDLQNQRETMQRSRNRLEEMNSVLGKSSRVLSGMMRRIIQNRILLVGVCAIMLIVIGLAIYFIVRKDS